MQSMEGWEQLMKEGLRGMKRRKDEEEKKEEGGRPCGQRHQFWEQYFQKHTVGDRRNKVGYKVSLATSSCLAVTNHFRLHPTLGFPASP